MSTPPKTSSKVKEITLTLSDTGYEKTMFFDRFFLKERDSFIFICFWYQNEAGDIEDSFCAVIAKTDIIKVNKSLKDYFGKVNVSPSSCAFSMPLGTSFKNAKTIRHISCARSEGVCELGLIFFPLHSVINKGDIIATPVAALLSSTQTHIDFLRNLISIVESK